MIRATMLGCAGSKPSVLRDLTALLLQVEGRGILIDCGEGTQRSLMKTKSKIFDISVICLTHVHADHTFGLPGLLSSINQIIKNEGTYQSKEIVIIAPINCKNLMQAVTNMVGANRIQLRYIWLTEEVEELEFDKMIIKAYKLKHSTDCYGFRVEEKINPHFSIEKATSSGLDSEAWKFLQNGHNIISDREFYSLRDITDGEVCKRSVAYAVDTLPCEGLAQCIQDASLAIVEGMYATNEEALDKDKSQHLTMKEAIEIAKANRVGELWITHYSQAFLNPPLDLQKFMANEEDKGWAKCCDCGLTTDIVKNGESTSRSKATLVSASNQRGGSDNVFHSKKK